MRKRPWMPPLLGCLIIVGTVVPAGAAETEGSLRVQVQTATGAAVSSAMVTLNGAFLVASDPGVFDAVGSGGSVEIEAPAYLPAAFAWEGTSGRLIVTLAARPVLALRVAGAAAASRWSSMLDIADSTAVNALVIDLKDESGRVFSQTPSGIAASVGASAPLFDLAARAEAAHDAGLYVIVRVVAFQDPVAAQAEPSWAVWNTATGGPYNKAGQWFLDPWDDDARSYALTLAEDACTMGVDEVQFDYLRFPDGYPSSVRFDGSSTTIGRSEAIATFLAEARTRLNPEGCAVAADIFGFITSTTGDGGIGQKLEDLAGVADVLSPMLYPSHYSTGWFGFSDPNAQPYEVVSRALVDGQERLGDAPAILRPWMQAFYYSNAQIDAEIRAADDRGVGWMLWNVASNFSTGSIPGAGDLEVEAARSTKRFAIQPDSGFWDVPSESPFDTELIWLAQGGSRPDVILPPTTRLVPPWS